VKPRRLAAAIRGGASRSTGTSRVPSAHRLTEGQELRSSEAYRLVLTSGALSSLKALPNPGSSRLQTAMVLHSGPSVTFISQLEGDGGSMVAISDLPAGLTSYAPLFVLAQDGHAFKHGSFDTSGAITSPAELEHTLRSAGFERDFLAACKTAPKYRHNLVLLMGAQRIKPYEVSGGEQPTLHEYGLLTPHDMAPRLPAEHAALAPLRIGVVGLGSMGGKIAVSLARSGLRRFLLVDDDVLLPGNICRHESSWASVGLHKVRARSRKNCPSSRPIWKSKFTYTAARRKKAAGSAVASISRSHDARSIGGQESAMRAARVLSRRNNSHSHISPCGPSGSLWPKPKAKTTNRQAFPSGVRRPRLPP
jgi:hypothetical protein